MIAENGTAKLLILISAKVGTETKIRANELASYLERITGGKFEIKKGMQGPGIFVGTIQQFPTPSAADGLRVYDGYDGRDAYAIRTEGGCIKLLGVTDLGVSHAVSRFLESFGCRWFFPGSVWEVVPRRSKLTFSGNETNRPEVLGGGFRIRSGAAVRETGPGRGGSHQELVPEEPRSQGLQERGRPLRPQRRLPVLEGVRSAPGIPCADQGRRGETSADRHRPRNAQGATAETRQQELGDVGPALRVQSRDREAGDPLCAGVAGSESRHRDGRRRAGRRRRVVPLPRVCQAWRPRQPGVLPGQPGGQGPSEEPPRQIGRLAGLQLALRSPGFPAGIKRLCRADYQLAVEYEIRVRPPPGTLASQGQVLRALRLLGGVRLDPRRLALRADREHPLRGRQCGFLRPARGGLPAHRVRQQLGTPGRRALPGRASALEFVGGPGGREGGLLRQGIRAGGAGHEGILRPRGHGQRPTGRATLLPYLRG